MTSDVIGTAWTGCNGRLRRRLPGLRHLMLAALVGTVACLAAPEYARADDFNRLLQSAGEGRTVQALVTGWRAITGDEASLGTSGTGPVAVTGDEFVKRLGAASSRLSLRRRYRNFPVLALEMDADALRAAKAHGSGVEVWDDPVLEPLLDASVSLVGAPQAWESGYSGWGLAVAVIDDGADTSHPFIEGRTVFEACFADVCPNGQSSMYGPGAAQPAGTHGTHVAGIVLGRPVQDLVGVGPNLHLLAINVANRQSKGMSGSSILAGLDVVLTLAQRYPGIIGAVNMSLGASRDSSGHCRSRIWDLAAREFARAGVAVVVATGNDSRRDWAAPVGFPACIEGFVSVGAVTKSRKVASFSNSGPALDLLAPGADIGSSVIRDGRRGFARLDGTSMAAPHVAAAMAILQQALPGSSVAERLNVLQRTGKKIRDPRNGIKAVMIDVGRAVEQIQASAVREKEEPVPQMTVGPETAPPVPGQPAPKPPRENPRTWKSIVE